MTLHKDYTAFGGMLIFVSNSDDGDGGDGKKQ